MDEFELTDEMRDAQRAAWHRYLDEVQPFRPLLHAYCLKLTRRIWDAEDLAQETLVRGFQRLACHHDPIANARAYLLRIATHTWIDWLRRRDTEARLAPEAAADPVVAAPASAGELRDAGRALLQRLAPREQAAVVLKDLFDMSLEEVAVVLETSVGAVKAALHRGRQRLREPEASSSARRPVPSVALVDRFVELFNAGDREGLIDVILNNASVSNVGVGEHYGEASLRGKHSWVEGALGGHPEWPEVFRFESQRAERAVFQGEPIVLFFRTREKWGGEALEGIFRLEEEEGLVSRLHSYSFCPETMRAVAEALALPVRTGMYRYPTSEPGRSYTEAEPAGAPALSS
jgi:RNA polymerase sigma-70 factor (ECF subfamily)